jgi:hypothetical protein
MKEDSNNLNLPDSKGDHIDQDDRNGYPEYPASEDIYQQFREEKDIDPEDINAIKAFNNMGEFKSMNEKDYHDDVSGSDLDIPDSEMDDILENAGNGDEENDYYSLGGDDHIDLEEDQGE